MELTFLKTDAQHKDFVALVALLDADLAIRDGDDHDFYDQYNGLEAIKYTVLVYQGDKAVGCGAIKKWDEHTMEVKWMYVSTGVRGKGIASKILLVLEEWAKEIGFERCILETGKMQPEAIALYKKSEYNQIENYGQYAGVENSLCFEKKL